MVCEDVIYAVCVNTDVSCLLVCDSMGWCVGTCDGVMCASVVCDIVCDSV